MSQSESSENQNISRQSNNRGKILRLFSSSIREILAFIVWGYVIIKLFVFDIDIFLIEKLSPNYIWLLHYKFFILIGIISIIWLVTKNKQMILWSLFILFYPLIVFFWRIPLFIFQLGGWNLTFAFVDSIIPFFKSIKITFIALSVFLISTAITLTVFNKVLLWLSTAILAGILLLVYLHRTTLVFKPIGIYQIYVDFFSLSENLKHRVSLGLDEYAVKFPFKNVEEKSMFILGMLVIENRACKFIAKGLKTYLESGIYFISSILSILILVLYTIFSFALINFGVFKINQNFYSFSHTPTFFDFYYYSFNVLMFNSVQEIVATTHLSKVILMIESFFALFLVAILISLVLSIKSQKHTDELKDAIKKLTEEGVLIEQFINEWYGFDNIAKAADVVVESNNIVSLYVLIIDDVTKPDH